MISSLRGVAHARIQRSGVVEPALAGEQRRPLEVDALRPMPAALVGASTDDELGRAIEPTTGLVVALAARVHGGEQPRRFRAQVLLRRRGIDALEAKVRLVGLPQHEQRLREGELDEVARAGVEGVPVTRQDPSRLLEGVTRNPAARDGDQLAHGHACGQRGARPLLGGQLTELDTEKPIYEVVTQPFYWDKTMHGLHDGSPAAVPEAAVAAGVAPPTLSRRASRPLAAGGAEARAAPQPARCGRSSHARAAPPCRSRPGRAPRCSP